MLRDGVREAVEKLESWHQSNPALFTQYFETRLLDLVVAGTPGGIWKLRPKDSLFSLHVCDLLVLDEASQMSLPEADAPDCVARLGYHGHSVFASPRR